MATRSRSALPLLAAAAALAAATFGLRPAFVPPPADRAGASRREALSLGAATLAASAGVLPAFAEAEAGKKEKGYLILPDLPGPFEVDPKDAIIVGDADAPQAKKARSKIQSLLQEAEVALTKLTDDDQVDLSYVVTDYSLADLREATNTVNNLMDEATAAGTQRLQRLMLHNKYLMEDEIPFPVSKKGVVQKRGPTRTKRVKSYLNKYIQYSKELLQFL